MVKAGAAVDDGHRRGRPAARAGRHPHRRRQHPLPRHHPPHEGARRRRACSTSAPASPAARKGRCKGPSIMPGGDPTAWPHVKPIFQAIAAKVDDGVALLRLGRPRGGRATSSRWSTTASSTATCSSSASRTTCMKDAARPERRRAARGLRPVEQGRARQLPDRDHRATSSATRTRRRGKPLVDLILDTAGQKGTGKWTVDSATDTGHRR